MNSNPQFVICFYSFTARLLIVLFYIINSIPCRGVQTGLTAHGGRPVKKKKQIPDVLAQDDADDDGDNIIMMNDDDDDNGGGSAAGDGVNSVVNMLPRLL